MNLSTHISQKKKGFTLIELLIVIGVLGILAAGLLAAIDPIEQTRRGQDATKKNLAKQYVDAMNRYYAANNAFPWGAATPTNGNAITDASNTTYTNALVTSGELKSSFPGNTTLGSLLFSYSATDGPLVCFIPDSKSVKLDPTAIYSSTGGAGPAACPSAALDTCYFCMK